MAAQLSTSSWQATAPRVLEAVGREVRALGVPEEAWFTVASMYFDDQVRLCFNAEIEIGAKRYPIRLTYPQTFPYTPISVLPQSPERWSEHQWGRGELCLEWGPDNWTPDITGAQMVESAYRLLHGETPNDADAHPVWRSCSPAHAGPS